MNVSKRKLHSDINFVRHTHLQIFISYIYEIKNTGPLLGDTMVHYFGRTLRLIWCHVPKIMVDHATKFDTLGYTSIATEKFELFCFGPSNIILYNCDAFKLVQNANKSII